MTFQLCVWARGQAGGNELLASSGRVEAAGGRPEGADVLGRKWASHVSYSNDVSLVESATGQEVTFSHGKLVSVQPRGLLEY
mmetsp:Transcript_18814/g.47458  ORF Transcript_18814/g.47458 Transcript_18814/m.47458 type:complete len:82 (+) Transcript_18814:173-418(+)|eukprot:CAMPEP_0174918950 /NCGR_PEP_ID=MMETSP1355-20121228/3387_1 /TAXON_ID=464990 /ORGANISM="Hemiselmis tepida, Strain CCMP443" /LENGTH=81 /DNA_ID=CAMNT_0016164153 /DNA_START=156 /DNA_END=401 /DNA_ORIENTATION=+